MCLTGQERQDGGEGWTPERRDRLEGTDSVGVGDGYRTRDLLSHSQAFYH